MTEFLGTCDDQIAYELTGLMAAAEEEVAARPERQRVPCPAVRFALAAKACGFLALHGRA